MQQSVMLFGLVALSLCAVVAPATEAPCFPTGLADLNAGFRLSGGTMGLLTGYRAWGSDGRPGHFTWYTFGYPWLQRNSSNLVMYETTPTELKLKVKMLSKGMKEALLEDAKRRYTSQKPTLDDIKLMPISSISCTVQVAGHGDQTGNVKRLISEPFSLDFQVGENTPVREQILRRINERGDQKLTYKCRVRSTMKNNQVICEDFTIDGVPENVE